jgi:hypothetical protein
VRSFSKEQQHGGSPRKDTVVNSQKGLPIGGIPPNFERLKYAEFRAFDSDFSGVYH